MSAAATFSQFEELMGVNIQTLPAVINAVAKNNPARAQAMVLAFQNTERLHQASQQAQRAQAEIAQARHAVWTKGEDAKFDASIASEPAEVVHEVTEPGASHTARGLRHFDPEGFAQIVQTNPGFRSAEAQRLLFDTIKTKLAAEKLAAKKVVPVPQVQRPGVSRPASSYSDEEAASACARSSLTQAPRARQNICWPAEPPDNAKETTQCT